MQVFSVTPNIETDRNCNFPVGALVIEIAVVWSQSRPNVGAGAVSNIGAVATGFLCEIKYRNEQKLQFYRQCTRY